MTILQALRSVNAYPLTDEQLEIAAISAGLDPQGDAMGAMVTKEYTHAKANVYSLLAEAPNISQGGITFSFSAEEKKQFRLVACKLYDAIGIEMPQASKWGYQGEDF